MVLVISLLHSPPLPGLHSSPSHHTLLLVFFLSHPFFFTSDSFFSVWVFFIYSCHRISFFVFEWVAGVAGRASSPAGGRDSSCGGIVVTFKVSGQTVCLVGLCAPSRVRQGRRHLGLLRDGWGGWVVGRGGCVFLAACMGWRGSFPPVSVWISAWYSCPARRRLLGLR